MYQGLNMDIIGYSALFNPFKYYIHLNWGEFSKRKLPQLRFQFTYYALVSIHLPQLTLLLPQA